MTWTTRTGKRCLLALAAAFCTAVLLNRGNNALKIARIWSGDIPRIHRTGLRPPAFSVDNTLEAAQQRALNGDGRQPGIRLNTFLYLVLGSGQPTQRWLSRSNWECASLLYMSWKTDVSANLQAQVSGGKFRYAFYPNSTWTTARNRQAELGQALEREQGWRFEYFVFFDEDAFLSHREPWAPERVLVDAGSDDAALRRLNTLLLRDRPMKAGVAFNEFAWDAHNFDCQRRCQADNVVHAQHASASGHLGRYSQRFDDSNWWLSAYILNMYTSALAKDYCNYYTEVLVEIKRQVHSFAYPAGIGWSENSTWSDAMRYTNDCLAAANFPGFVANANETEIRARLQTSLDRTPLGWPKCLRHKAGVDFGKLLGEHRWPTKLCR